MIVTDLSPLVVADALATVVFAVTGALVASRKQMDIFGFLWLATATGVGGGTLRDLLLGAPVFWVEQPRALALCLGVGTAMHFLASLVQSRMQAILVLDAFGMAFAAVAGTVKAQEAGVAGLVAVVLGVFTASAGGIIRDLLGQEPSIVLRREIYQTAALLGALCVVLLPEFGLGGEWAAIAGFVAAASLRLAAVIWSLSLPVFRPRAGRDYSDEA